MYSATDLIPRILIHVITDPIPNVQETIAQVRCGAGLAPEKPVRRVLED
jgi:hypothetical protein